MRWHPKGYGGNRRGPEQIVDRGLGDLAGHVRQALEPALHHTRDHVDAGPAGVGAARVSAHAIRDEKQTQLVVDEVGIFVVAADPTHVGDRPGAQTHLADHNTPDPTWLVPDEIE